MVPQKDTIREILIVHTWGIGDLILLTPVLNAVHKLNPGIKISFLFFPKAAAIPIIGAPYLGQLHYCSWNPKVLIRTILTLRLKNYDVAMFSSGVTPWKAWLFLLLLRSSKRIGEYKTSKLPFLCKQVLFDETKSRTESNYLLFSTFLSLPSWSEALNHKDDLNLKTSFELEDQNLSWASRFVLDNGLNTQKLVGIHPGCNAKNSYRRWDRDKFVSLIELIKSKLGFKILIIAGPDEMDVGLYISKKSGCPLLVNQPLKDVAGVISLCDYFINTDSSLGHLASCFGVRSLTIFGPGNENQTAPFSPYSKIIREQADCAPCVGRKKISCEVECLNKLSVEKVFKAFQAITINPDID